MKSVHEEWGSGRTREAVFLSDNSHLIRMRWTRWMPFHAVAYEDCVLTTYSWTLGPYSSAPTTDHLTHRKSITLPSPSFSSAGPNYSAMDTELSKTLPTPSVSLIV